MRLLILLCIFFHITPCLAETVEMIEMSYDAASEEFSTGDDIWSLSIRGYANTRSEITLTRLEGGGGQQLLEYMQHDWGLTNGMSYEFILNYDAAGNLNFTIANGDPGTISVPLLQSFDEIWITLYNSFEDERGFPETFTKMTDILMEGVSFSDIDASRQHPTEPPGIGLGIFKIWKFSSETTLEGQISMSLEGVGNFPDRDFNRIFIRGRKSSDLTPAVEIKKGSPDLNVFFQGILQSSSDLENWDDIIPQPGSPFLVVPSNSKFYRARD